MRTMTRMDACQTNHALLLWKSFLATIVNHEKQERENALKMARFLAKLTHQGTLKMFLAWVDFCGVAMQRKGFDESYYAAHDERQGEPCDDGVVPRRERGSSTHRGDA